MQDQDQFRDIADPSECNQPERPSAEEQREAEAVQESDIMFELAQDHEEDAPDEPTNCEDSILNLRPSNVE